MKDYVKYSLVAVVGLIVGGMLGASLIGDRAGGRYSTSIQDFSEGISVDGTTVIDGSGNVDAPITSSTGSFSGQVTLKEASDSSTIQDVGDDTLTIAMSGTTFYTATGTTATLPAATAGVKMKFVIAGAFDTTNFIIDSAEGDNIEGALIVAGAVVDCDAEDQINFVADGENLGDFVELISDGTSWYITQSGALTSAKLTCTDPS